ncbi:MAG: stage II sporulation protein R [Candidatus Pseudoruminococcus sp.]|nr:stage II sporulation protein R [Ruminococcus sp.]MDY2783447.1 stage II sporulation protein R [Candidatus Pseudoruminococcus sp.]
MKIKIILKIVATALAMAFAFSVVSFAGACEDIESRVLRLHILANSDSESDQALKLKVRDAILEISPEIFGNTSSKQEAIKRAKADLPKIIDEAERVIKAEGYNYNVRAEVVNDKFNTRVYENFTLPAGDYDAVRIIIGSGSGHNWWCVMFPALCLPSAEGNELQNELPDSEKCIVDNNENNNGYEIRFGVVEAVSSFSDWLCSLF